MLEVLVVDRSYQAQGGALRDQWIRDAEGFVLVYSITNWSTFNRIRRYHKLVKRVREASTAGTAMTTNPHHSPIMLVGYNCQQITERKVLTQDGFGLADTLGCGFVGVPAKSAESLLKGHFSTLQEPYIDIVCNFQGGQGLQTRRIPIGRVDSNL
jgi:GTPase KRas protein